MPEYQPIFQRISFSASFVLNSIEFTRLLRVFDIRCRRTHSRILRRNASLLGWPCAFPSSSRAAPRTAPLGASRPRLMTFRLSAALFQLNQKINAGDVLYIRSHRPDGVPVEVKAQVMRVSAANYGTSRVGVSIIRIKRQLAAPVCRMDR